MACAWLHSARLRSPSCRVSCTPLHVLFLVFLRLPCMLCNACLVGDLCPPHVISVVRSLSLCLLCVDLFGIKGMVTGLNSFG